MRYLITLLFAALSLNAVGQQALSSATLLEVNEARLAGEQLRLNQRGGGNILFSEDFSNGFDGINGNGAWTASDNANDSLWIWVAPGNTGYYSNGDATGVSHPAGEYSTNIGALVSETPGNGWMVFDCDYFNTPIEEGHQDTDGSLTSPLIDFSNDGSVILSWDQYFRYCCFPYAPVYVDVTNDGGVTWTTFDGHGSFIEAENVASANPLPTSLDISCVAAYSDSVQFRFTYTQAPETGNSYSHYYWGIDDVVITSNDNADDLAMVQLTNGDIWNVWEYRVTPMEQVIPASEGGVLAGVLYRNNGTENQENVEVLVEVLNETGDEVLASVTETLTTVYSFANSFNCPVNSQDTIYIETGWEPSSTGNYILRSTLTSGSITDSSPEDNTMSKVIVFSDDEYGHDDEAALDEERSPRESDLPGLWDPSGHGCFYHTVNSGSTAYGITVDFGESCGLSIDDAPAYLEFETRLYYYDNTVGITDSPFESAFWTYDTDWSNAGPIYLPFEYPIDLDADAVYFAGVIAEYESEGGLTVWAQLNSDTDNSTGEYNQAGDGSFIWFTSQTYTPAVRLVLGGSYVGCTDPVACNYNPEATQDDDSCIFICNGCTDVETCNYNPSSTIDDGSCIYPEPYYDCFGSCLNDFDGDGICDELEVYGCTYPDALNFNEEAIADDGSCIYEEFDLDAVYDEGYTDGFENGENSVICPETSSCPSDLNGDGSVGMSDLLIFLSSFGDVCEIDEDLGFLDCGDVINHEGYGYSTVQIGEQCWFSENCRYLPSVSPSSASSTTEPYYYVYNYEGTDIESAKATSNYATSGVLYNWPAVMTEGICPSGWHIPSYGEFTELSDFLGGEGVAGGKMKEDGYDHWNSPNTGAANSSGFTGLPGGYRYSGGFYLNGIYGYWWSASESGSRSWGLRLSSGSDDVSFSSLNRYNGFSARCVKD